MSHTEVDHIVVAAASLAQGAAWCEETLGVTPQPGGAHPLMGTHNRLVKIATPQFANAYLEIIAIDPAAAPGVGRARWFELDDPALQARIAAAPRLVHAVVRSSMLDMHRWGLITLGQAPGDPIGAERDTPHGRLQWQIVVRSDGRLPCGGALPTLIQWQGKLHPADHMPESGVALQSLTLRGVPDRVRTLLRLRGAAVQEAADGPALSATLSTPLGPVTLEA